MQERTCPTRPRCTAAGCVAAPTWTGPDHLHLDGPRVLVNKRGRRKRATLPVDSAARRTTGGGCLRPTSRSGRGDARAIPCLRGGRGVVQRDLILGWRRCRSVHGVYRASKAAVAALDESLRAELPRPASGCSRCPGPIATDMLAGFGSGRRRRAFPTTGWFRGGAACGPDGARRRRHAGRGRPPHRRRDPRRRRVARVAPDLLASKMLAGADAGAETRMAVFVTGLGADRRADRRSAQSQSCRYASGGASRRACACRRPHARSTRFAGPPSEPTSLGSRSDRHAEVAAEDGDATGAGT